jgi:hypothetical protein
MSLKIILYPNIILSMESLIKLKALLISNFCKWGYFGYSNVKMLDKNFLHKNTLQLYCKNNIDIDNFNIPNKF